MSKILLFVDENLYIKQARALRKYFMKSYKDLIFNITYELKKENLPNGDYEKEIYTDKNFKEIFGTIRIKYFVNRNIVGIKELEPSQYLLDLYKVLVPTYKGIPYRNDYDLFKIKLLKGEYK